MCDKYIKSKDLCIVVKSHIHQYDDITKIFHFLKEKYSDQGVGILIPPSWDTIYVETLYKPMRFVKGMLSLQRMCGLSAIPERLRVNDLLDFLCKYGLSWINDDKLVRTAKCCGHITLESLKSIIGKAHIVKNKKICHSLLTKGACNMVLEGEVPVNQLGFLVHAEQELRKLQKFEDRKHLDITRGEYRVFTNCQDYGAIHVYSHAFNETEFDDYGSSGKIPKFVIQKDDKNVEFVIFSEQYKKIMTKKKHLYIYSPTSNRGKTQMMQQILMQCNAAEITDLKNFADVSPHAQFYVIDEYDHNHRLSFDALKRFTGGVASSFSGNVKSFGKSFTPRADAQLILFSNFHLFALYGEWCPKLQRHFINPLHAEILENRFHIIKVDPSSGSLTNDIRSYKHPSIWDQQEIKEEIDKLFEHYIGTRYLDRPLTDISKQYAGKVFLKKLEILVRAHDDGESPHRYIPLNALCHLPYCTMVQNRISEDVDLINKIML